MFLITEVLTATEGRYVAEWLEELDVHAKAIAMEIGGQADAHWQDNQKVELLISRPIALGYRDVPLPME